MADLTRKDVTVRSVGDGRHEIDHGTIRLGEVYKCNLPGCLRWWMFRRAGAESSGMWESRKNAIQALLDEVNDG